MDLSGRERPFPAFGIADITGGPLPTMRIPAGARTGWRFNRYAGAIFHRSKKVRNGKNAQSTYSGERPHIFYSVLPQLLNVYCPSYTDSPYQRRYPYASIHRLTQTTPRAAKIGTRGRFLLVPPSGGDAFGLQGPYLLASSRRCS